MAPRHFLIGKSILEHSKGTKAMTGGMEAIAFIEVSVFKRARALGHFLLLVFRLEHFKGTKKAMTRGYVGIRLCCLHEVFSVKGQGHKGIFSLVKGTMITHE